MPSSTGKIQNLLKEPEFKTQVFISNCINYHFDDTCFFIRANKFLG